MAAPKVWMTQQVWMAKIHRTSDPARGMVAT